MVAEVLGDLAVLMGKPETARQHYEQAVRVARRWGAQHWVDAVLDRLAALDHPAQTRG